MKGIKDMKENINAVAFTTMMTVICILCAIQFYKDGDFTGIVMMVLGVVFEGLFSIWAWAGLIKNIKKGS